MVGNLLSSRQGSGRDTLIASCQVLGATDVPVSFRWHRRLRMENAHHVSNKETRRRGSAFDNGNTRLPSHYNTLHTPRVCGCHAKLSEVSV